MAKSRRPTAWQMEAMDLLSTHEERILLYKELVKVYEQTLRERVCDLRAELDPLGQLEGEMEIMMERKVPEREIRLPPKQFDV